MQSRPRGCFIGVRARGRFLFGTFGTHCAGTAPGQSPGQGHPPRIGHQPDLITAPARFGLSPSGDEEGPHLTQSASGQDTYRPTMRRRRRQDQSTPQWRVGYQRQARARARALREDSIDYVAPELADHRSQSREDARLHAGRHHGPDARSRGEHGDLLGGGRGPAEAAALPGRGTDRRLYCRGRTLPRDAAGRRCPRPSSICFNGKPPGFGTSPATASAPGT